MTFIQTPIVDNGNVHEVKFLEGNPQGLDGSFQCRRVSLVKSKATLGEQTTTLAGFLLTSFRQGTIDPTSKL